MKNKSNTIPIPLWSDPIEFLKPLELVKTQLQNVTFTKKIENCLSQGIIWHEIKTSDAEKLSDEDTHLKAPFEEIKGGLTNFSYRLQTNKGTFFLRVPGSGSKDHLSRQDEAHNLRCIEHLGFNIKIFFFNPESGLYVGEYLDDVRALTPSLLSEKQTMMDVARIFKALHSSPKPFKNTLTVFERLRDLLNKIKQHHHVLTGNAAQLKKRMIDLERICQQDASGLVPCHNDPTYLNFLYQGKKLRLCDWEYSGNNKALFDLANFANTAELSKPSQQILLQAYFSKSPTQQLWQVFSAYKQATDLWYYLWAELQLANGSNVVPHKELKALAEKHWHRAMGSAINLPKPHALALNF